MDTKAWLDQVTNKTSVNAVAAAIDLTQSTLNTQLRSKGGLKPETAVRIAREYGYSPIRALVDLGLITEEEAKDATGVKEIATATALSKASEDELLTEIGRRLGAKSKAKAEKGTTIAVVPPKR